jgi:sugar lactone lactonase YvrE
MPRLMIVLLLATGCRSGAAPGPPEGSPDARLPSGPSRPTAAGLPAADPRPAPAPDASPPADVARSPDAPAADDIPPGMLVDAGPGDAASAAVPGAPPNCANLPSEPVATTRVPGIDPVEDITFDDSGNLYWNAMGGGIVKSRADGSSMLFVPQVKFQGAMRWTPSGDLYISTDRGLEKVSPNGARTVVLPYGGDGINAIEVDRQGRVYVSNIPEALIQRYDPQANRDDVISKFFIQNPNGLTFNPSFDMLYVGRLGRRDTPTLYRIAIGKDGTAGQAEVWVTNVGSGTYDGMAADECGNIYVANSGGEGEILRLTPDGKSHTVLVKRPGETLHNFMWGRGQGWSQTKLYIVSLGKGLFEADPGARGKRYW